MHSLERSSQISALALVSGIPATLTKPTIYST
jgi:hypothetical protein